MRREENAPNPSLATWPLCVYASGRTSDLSQAHCEPLLYPLGTHRKATRGACLFATMFASFGCHSRALGILPLSVRSHGLSVCVPPPVQSHTPQPSPIPHTPHASPPPLSPRPGLSACLQSAPLRSTPSLTALRNSRHSRPTLSPSPPTPSTPTWHGSTPQSRREGLAR